MKAVMHMAALAAAGATVMYAAVGSDAGVLFHSPLATIGAGLIGLGLTLEALRRGRPAAAA